MGRPGGIIVRGRPGAMIVGAGRLPGGEAEPLRMDEPGAPGAPLRPQGVVRDPSIELCLRPQRGDLRPERFSLAAEPLDVSVECCVLRKEALLLCPLRLERFAEGGDLRGSVRAETSEAFVVGAADLALRGELSVGLCAGRILSPLL